MVNKKRSISIFYIMTSLAVVQPSLSAAAQPVIQKLIFVTRQIAMVTPFSTLEFPSLRTYVINGNKLYIFASMRVCKGILKLSFRTELKPSMLQIGSKRFCPFFLRSGVKCSALEAVMHPTGGHFQKEMRSQTSMKFHIIININQSVVQILI